MKRNSSRVTFGNGSSRGHLGRTVLPALFTTMLTSCAGLLPRPVPIPADLQTDGDHYKVSGGVSLFEHQVKFGPFKAYNASSSALSDERTPPSVRNGEISQSKFNQTSSFDFVGLTGAKFHAECQREGLVVKEKYNDDNPNDPSAGVISEDSVFECSIKRPYSDPIAVRLENATNGTAQGKDLKLSITTVDTAGNDEQLMTSDAGGFVVTENNMAAFVDVTEVRAVALSRKLAPQRRDEIAAVCAALLVMNEMYD